MLALCVVEKETEIKVHDGAESVAWSDMMHPAKRVEAAKQGCRRRRYACPVCSGREDRN